MIKNNQEMSLENFLLLEFQNHVQYNRGELGNYHDSLVKFGELLKQHQYWDAFLHYKSDVVRQWKKHQINRIRQAESVNRNPCFNGARNRIYPGNCD